MQESVLTHEFNGREFPVYLDKFSSPMDMISSIRKRPLKNTYRPGSDYFSENPKWYTRSIAGQECSDSSDLIKALRTGAVDKDLGGTLRTMYMRPLSAEEEATVPSQRVYALYGTCPKIGRVLSGNMKCMVNHVRPPLDEKAVKIGVDITLCDWYSGYYSKIGEAVARAVISLERLNYHVGLEVGATVMTTDKKKILCMVRKVKGCNDQFNIRSAMFPLTEQAYLDLTYGWTVRHPKSCCRKSDHCIGYTVNGSSDDFEDFYDKIFGKDAIHLRYEDLAKMLSRKDYDVDSLANYIKALVTE